MGRRAEGKEAGISSKRKESIDTQAVMLKLKAKIKEMKKWNEMFRIQKIIQDKKIEVKSRSCATVNSEHPIEKKTRFDAAK